MKHLILTLLIAELLLTIAFVFYKFKSFNTIVTGVFLIYILATLFKFFSKGALSFEIQLLARIVFYACLLFYIIRQKVIGQMNSYDLFTLLSLLLVYCLGVYIQSTLIVVLIPCTLLALLVSRKLFRLEYKEHVLILALFVLDAVRVGIDKIW